MSLKEQIQKDLIEAMKAKNETALSAIRLLKTAIMKLETSGPAKEATEDDVLQIVGKEIKSRKESIEQYEKGGRPELAEKERAEIMVLEKYMPPQLSEDEVRSIIKDTIAETGVSSKAEIGKLMGALMPKVKGKADGSQVNKIVQELLR